MSNYQHVSNFPRSELDFYPTPLELIEPILPFLVDRLGNENLVWEPFCGDGAISRPMADAGLNVYSTDIKSYGYDKQDDVCDFFNSPPPSNLGGIVSNPPYGNLPTSAIRHSLDYLKESDGVCAMLLRSTWDTGSTRADLYEWPFTAKVNLLWRPHWFEKTEDSKSPMHSFAWFIWDFAQASHTPENYYLKRGEIL